MGTRQKGNSLGLTAYLTLDRLWALVAVLVPMLATLMRRMGAIDLAYHVRLGEEMLATGALVRTDTMTFSSTGTTWVDQQWGAQILLALLHRAGGWATLGVVRMLLTGAIFYVVYLACRQRGASGRTASLLSLGSFLIVVPALAMRPQMFVVPLFALTLWIVMGRKAHPGRLWILPVLTAAWANLHGSFFLLLLVLVLATAEEAFVRDRQGLMRLLVVGALSLAATAATPFGPAVWLYVWNLTTDPVVRTNITEWAPLTLSGYPGWVFFGSALGLGGYLASRGKRTPPGDLLWLAAFFLLALPAIRGMLWWGIVAPVILAGLLPVTKDETSGRRGSPPMNLAVALALVGSILALLPWWRSGDDSVQARRLLAEAPIGATDAIGKALPPGSRVVATQPWASWFEYALPDMPVFVDPRIELFSEEVWSDYSEIRFVGAGWREVLERWEADAVVVDLRTWDLQERLAADPGWKLIYEDEMAAVFVRA